MTTDFQPTVPVPRDHDLRTKLRERQDEDWKELKRRLRPSGLDHQGRFPTRDTLNFADSDIDHFTRDGVQTLIVVLLVSASLIAVCVVALFSRFA